MAGRQEWTGWRSGIFAFAPLTPCQFVVSSSGNHFEGGRQSLPLHSAFARAHWETIAAKLREGSYDPSPVRRVLIPKDRGRFRALGIPTVLDRVIQQAIAQVLGEIHDPTFSEH